MVGVEGGGYWEVDVGGVGLCEFEWGSTCVCFWSFLVVKVIKRGKPCRSHWVVTTSTGDGETRFLAKIQNSHAKTKPPSNPISASFCVRREYSERLVIGSHLIILYFYGYSPVSPELSECSSLYPDFASIQSCSYFVIAPARRNTKLPFSIGGRAKAETEISNDAVMRCRYSDAVTRMP